MSSASQQLVSRNTALAALVLTSTLGVTVWMLIALARETAWTLLALTAPFLLAFVGASVGIGWRLLRNVPHSADRISMPACAFAFAPSLGVVMILAASAFQYSVPFVLSTVAVVGVLLSILFAVIVYRGAVPPTFGFVPPRPEVLREMLRWHASYEGGKAQSGVAYLAGLAGIVGLFFQFFILVGAWVVVEVIGPVFGLVTRAPAMMICKSFLTVSRGKVGAAFAGALAGIATVLPPLLLVTVLFEAPRAL